MSGYYDDPAFFEEYGKMARSRGLDHAGEWHQFRQMIPPCEGKTALDLGCGMGWHSKYLADCGAASVLGIDISENMLAKAREINASEHIEYRCCSSEDYTWPAETYDLILSNLVLHYIKDLNDIYLKVCRSLKPGGVFLFNIEHPSFTAGIRQEWIRNSSGDPVCWPIDDYFYPGPRTTDFLGQEIIKYHHTLTDIITPLLRLGLALTDLQEAMPPESMMEIPGMKDEMRRPMMLLARFEKKI